MRQTGQKASEKCPKSLVGRNRRKKFNYKRNKWRKESTKDTQEQMTKLIEISPMTICTIKPGGGVCSPLGKVETNNGRLEGCRNRWVSLFSVFRMNNYTGWWEDRNKLLRNNKSVSGLFRVIRREAEVGVGRALMSIRKKLSDHKKATVSLCSLMKLECLCTPFCWQYQFVYSSHNVQNSRKWANWHPPLIQNRFDWSEKL